MVSLITATTALNPNQEMTDFDYKKYSLENLENWMNDAISSSDATPQEIYDTIVGVVKEKQDYHKKQVDQADELLSLLNANSQGKIKEYDDCVDKILSCDKNDASPECQGAWNDFWRSDNNVEYNLREAEYYNLPEDKVTKWILPTQVDGLTGDCYVNLPDDLLELAGLKEGDTVQWIDRKDGSFEMKKVTERNEC